MDNEKFVLPIGSVVKLKGLKKPFMIFGMLQSNGIQEKKLFDYSAVPYPEGNIDIRAIIAFNRSKIEKVIYRGYEDESFQPWKELLLSRKPEEKVPAGQPQQDIFF